MNNHNNAISIIKSLTGQANILTIPRIFVDFLGSLDGALFLSQVIYWSDKSNSEWFYKSYKEWKDEICLSKYEVSKQSKKLQAMNLLETKLKKANGAPTVHYKFSFDEFEKSFVHFLDNGKLKNLTMESKETDQSLTETTTETTTETITPNGVSATQKSISEKQKLKSLTKDDFVKLQPKTAIKDRFLELTKLTMPKTKKQCGYWWSQFAEISHAAAEDGQRAIQAMETVVPYMRTEKLPITGPQSVVGLCRSVLSGQKLNGASDDKTHQRTNTQSFERSRNTAQERLDRYRNAI